MDYATGKYLVFWDSDDFFDPTALEKMYLRSEEDRADICVCGGSRCYESEGFEAETDAFLLPQRVPQPLLNSKANQPSFAQIAKTRRIGIPVRDIAKAMLRNAWSRLKSRNLIGSSMVNCAIGRIGEELPFRADS